MFEEHNALMMPRKTAQRTPLSLLRPLAVFLDRSVPQAVNDIRIKVTKWREIETMKSQKSFYFEHRFLGID